MRLGTTRISLPTPVLSLPRHSMNHSPALLGTPLTPQAYKVLLCGAGELGKEVAIELQRLGVEVIALDRYANAPAMQVAHRSYVLSMLDGPALKEIIEKEQPDLIVPEIEAIATQALVELEQQGYRVIPTAQAAYLTMNREGIRRLAAEQLQLPTTPYAFANSLEECKNLLTTIGLPCVLKPIMSSSGKGQSVIRNADELAAAWAYAQTAGRAQNSRVILESWVEFDFEITLLTIRHSQGTSFCLPIGHQQVNGDYRLSWQPQHLSDIALAKAQSIAHKITEALGGWGLFGVELFVKGDDIIFNEVSPRPHDTGLVTLISQDLSEFALHVRAILGLPIPNIRQRGPAASCALLVSGEAQGVQYHNIPQALSEPDTQLFLFGKPEIHGQRRMGVALALGDSIEQAKNKAQHAVNQIQVIFPQPMSQ